jgi:hypothetical protein
MLLDVAPNGAGRLFGCQSYKDFAPTELVIDSTECGLRMATFFSLLRSFRVLYIGGQAVAE